MTRARLLSPYLVALLVVLIGTTPQARSQVLVQPPEKYRTAAVALERWLSREVTAKQLPALSIALVDDQTVVWARGLGYTDVARSTGASISTVYRVGSVSKPITALVLMMLVEQGLIDLDAPVTRYLPDFRPRNPFGKQITLRQMLSHRSGLVRESPVGSYFDATAPSLEKMVASLNDTTLVFAPEARTSYSNAAVSVAGYVLERTRKAPFAEVMKKSLLDPLGMKSSSFALTPALKERLPRAAMWTYHRPLFDAPQFELGTPPAGNLYSTVSDMSRLMSFLFAGGRTADGKQLLKRETLGQMYTPQFVKKGQKSGFGIGFFVSEFEGRLRIGHGGAVYGYATEFAALPDSKLGVVVIAARDVANAVTRRAADVALKHMIAVQEGKPLPKIDMPSGVDARLASRLEGVYRAGDRTLELQRRGQRLWLWPGEGGPRVELLTLGKDKGLITDDLTGYGLRVLPEGDRLRIGKTLFERVEPTEPAPPPEKWRGLIGEYGPDHNILYILEKKGRLHALIEWVFLYPLTEESPDVYVFPDLGLYPGEKIVFTRDKSGRATKAVAASVQFERRRLEGEDGKTFRIRPQRPLDELRREALAASPPKEKQYGKPDLVDVTTLEATIKLDIRYATTNNFLGTPFYTSAKAYLQRPAAEALVRVHRKLAKQGYGLLIHDAYRPWHVTKMFHDATPKAYRLFVANPAQGSRHNRGCAVDLTLYDRATGKAIEMVSGYDEFADRAYPDYPGGTSLQRWHRDLLRRSMEAERFTVYALEWWHFDHADWNLYPILNQTFEELQAKGKPR
jgi:CubicO group peptidase (beta-lactamase class C family)/D-alanyl-D-alanine dipeptidase